MKAMVVACLPLAAAAGSSPAVAAASGAVRVYVGTYTSGESKGIYRLRLDLATGGLSPEGDPTETVNPSFLAFHPSGRFLYAVNETGDARRDPSGGVSAFAIDAKTGSLTFLNRQPSGGPAPCHLSVDKAGRHVLVANYWDGSVSVLPIGTDGRLGAATARIQHEGHGPNAERQEGPHAHSVHLDADNRFALVADLGSDRVAVYRFDAQKGTLTANEPAAGVLPPGSGPRHFAFHPDGRHAYVINELNATVTVFDYDPAKGALAPQQTVPTLPAGFTGANTTAEVVVRPDGRFVYASNRGHDSLALFSVDAATGRLTALGHQPTLGRQPRNFAIDPSGTFLLAANQDSDSVVVFRIDPASGKLDPVGKPLHVPRPVCLRMVVIP
jgi:6-phosphogluconolactonase